MTMLVDNITITVKAGNGGNGKVSFRHTKQKYKGGPDGGTGGKGGDLYFQGVDDLSALQQFRYKKRIEAESGVAGGSNNAFGKKGDDTIINIPTGTRITNLKTNERIEITNNDKILIAKGGIGGRGNNEFKTSTNQAPRYAEKGRPGEEKELLLELRLIADIGLIGLPNAGKSSLLRALTNAEPKIGDYPFTTLEPNLGVMYVDVIARNSVRQNDEAIQSRLPRSLSIARNDLVLADIPGLIEGASEGKGLGIQFLRHIEKTQLLVHCIASNSDNILQDYLTIRKELELYNKELLLKTEIILLTKTDLIDEKMLKDKIKLLKKKNKDILSSSVLDDNSIEKLRTMLSERIS